MEAELSLKNWIPLRDADQIDGESNSRGGGGVCREQAACALQTFQCNFTAVGEADAGNLLHYHHADERQSRICKR